MSKMETASTNRGAEGSLERLAWQAWDRLGHGRETLERLSGQTTDLPQIRVSAELRRYERTRVRLEDTIVRLAAQERAQSDILARLESVSPDLSTKVLARLAEDD